ncbi:hypothetical protein LINPERPRIM_LOCUS36197 [Linum perenne]
METSGGGNSDLFRPSSSGGASNSRGSGGLSAASIIQAPISALLEYSGLLLRHPSRSTDSDSSSSSTTTTTSDHLILHDPPPPAPPNGSGNGEVSIRIIGAGDHHDSDRGQLRIASDDDGVGGGLDSRPDRASSEVSTPPQSSNPSSTAEDGESPPDGNSSSGTNGRDSSYQRYDIQQAARWIEQVLPFSLLLLVVFIRQHLQGYSLLLNPLLRMYLLLLVEMISFKRNSEGESQMLTLIEYLMLLYRALLPTPVWYRFFLNKEYGSLFSSLMTGLYLTFKLTSVVEKVQSFFAALKALSRKEVNYGAYATSEQVLSLFILR